MLTTDAELRRSRSGRVVAETRLGRSAICAGLITALIALTGATPALADTRPNPLDLTKYKGKVVYLDFWASWCAPCKLAYPYVEQISSNYSRKDLVVITVNVDHSRERADAFLSEVEGRLPVVYDPSGAIAKKYHVSEMPTSVVIDRSGKVRFVQQGFFENKISQYESHIEALINEK